MRKVVVVVVTALALGLIGMVRAHTLGMTGDGSYAFFQTQPHDSRIPMTYSSCKPIRVEVNTDGIDDEATAKLVVLSAMGEISAASHLQLVYAGPTDRRPLYPDTTITLMGGARPVLVSFATSEEVPRLKGGVAGVGGSAGTTVGGAAVYVTGQATLDADYVNEALTHRSGWKLTKAVVMHELGHVVGLDHAPDGVELMSASGGRSELGPGDRRGLALLGKGPCV